MEGFLYSYFFTCFFCRVVSGFKDLGFGTLGLGLLQL